MAEENLGERSIGAAFRGREEDKIQHTGDKRRDLDRLLQASYIEPGSSLPKYKLSAKGEK